MDEENTTEEEIDEEKPHPLKRKRPRGNSHNPRETAQLKGEFLRLFRERGVIKQCCEVLGIERRLVYQWRDDDPDFAALFADAGEEFNDVIRNEIRRRAVDGWDEPIFFKDQQVGTVRKYSDRMLQLLARSRMAREFGDHMDVTSDGHSITPAYHAIIQNPELTELAARLAETLSLDSSGLGTNN